jgi:7-cyano-7-deazaguanine synthase
MGNTIVLLSGGMDSTVALFHTLDQIDKSDRSQSSAICLTFVYGQKHSLEVYAAAAVWKQARKSQYSRLLGDHRIVDLTHAFPPVGSLLGREPVRKYDGNLDSIDSVIDPSFIPHRNLVFLSIAAAWAKFLGADKIVGGLRGGFSDCTSKFEHETELLLRESDPSYPVSIASPTHCSREDTLRIALEIPECWEALSYTLTCFEGLATPCGQCLPCHKRAQGFQQIGLPDPLLIRLQANR